MLHKEIVVNNATGNESLTEQEFNDIVVGAVGTMAMDDKENLVYLLQQSGSLVSEINTQSEILDSAFKAIRDNENFRRNLNDYLVSQGDILDLSESSNFANGDGWSKIGSWFKTAGQNIGKGAKKIGSAVFTKENTQAIIGAGIGILSSKLQSQAQRGQGQQAIDYTNAQSNLEAIKLAQLQAQGGGAGTGDSGSTEKKNKWVLPVAIIGGVLVLGTILFFALRKRNN